MPITLAGQSQVLMTGLNMRNPQDILIGGDKWLKHLGIKIIHYTRNLGSFSVLSSDGIIKRFLKIFKLDI
jgi:hypothetical protein